MQMIMLVLAGAVVAMPVYVFGQARPHKQLETHLADDFESLVKLYKHLHRNPELSLSEQETARLMAQELRAVGCEVTEEIGGYGVVGVLENGPGPTVLVRADMDALPITEETGLDYASTRTVTGDDGQEVGVMHACGHDMHMSVFVGTARMLKKLATHWQGSLVFVAQPAEEIGQGSLAMLNDGLYEKFPRPDYALALHLSPNHAAGIIGYTEGYALANVDSVDLTVRGLGGHGAMPHLARDPVVLSAQIILALQTIVSRESAATEPVVITVGKIAGGTKRNIIPDEVVLELTVRTYADDSRKRVLEAITRVAEQTARAAGVPDNLLPVVSTADENPVPSLYNDPKLVHKVTAAMKSTLGNDAVVPSKPWMAAEDFARYGRVEPRLPSFLFFLGGANPEQRKKCDAGTAHCPGLHNSRMIPDLEPTLKTGITAMVSAVLAIAGTSP